MATTTQKDDRIDLRIETEQKNFLNYAAKIRNMKLSAFVLTSALREAEEIVADKAHFSIAEKQWKTFYAALDQPAHEIPKLRQLFSGPDPFKG
ncbi:MAG: DUF1778 domain-containing protein [Candidatus Omnitrophica bacterium]|nr:DUF1778 domain-containing protein [Candidatus Omnitrophota bacterium]